MSTERVPETDEFNEIAIQKENALKDLELETAKLVRRFLKETLRWLLRSSFFSFPKRLCISTASVAKEVTAALASAVAEALVMGTRPWLSPRCRILDQGVLFHLT